MINRIKKLFLSLAIIFVLYLSLVYFQSCKQDFGNNPVGTVQFPAAIDSIFNTSYTSNGNSFTCSTPSCHASGNNAGGMDLVDWQKALNGSNNGTMIIPYNGFWSHIIAYLNKDTNTGKPPVAYIDTNSVFYGIHKIDSHKVTTIMNWINDGAKSKDGQIAFTSVANTDKGFITNQAADLVAVVEPNEKRVIRLFHVGGIGSSLNTPHYVTLSPDKNYIYISLIGAGYLQKYDVNSYVQVSNNMQAGQSPAHIVISPDGSTGYITNFSSDHLLCGLTMFRTADMTVTGTLRDQRMPGTHGLALSKNGQYLYSTSQVGEYIFKVNTVYFSVADSLVKAPIDPSVPPSGNGTGNFKPYQCALSPNDSLLFVTCTAANQVKVYNTSDLSLVNTISVGLNPLILRFSIDGRYLFVCNRNDNTVSVINASTQSVQTTITDVGVQPHSVDFTADGQYALVACETQSSFGGHHPTVGSTKPGTSRVIQISNMVLLSNRLEMASFPAGIAIVK